MYRNDEKELQKSQPIKEDKATVAKTGDSFRAETRLQSSSCSIPSSTFWSNDLIF